MIRTKIFNNLRNTNTKTLSCIADVLGQIGVIQTTQYHILCLSDSTCICTSDRCNLVMTRNTDIYITQSISLLILCLCWYCIWVTQPTSTLNIVFELPIFAILLQWILLKIKLQIKRLARMHCGSKYYNTTKHFTRSSYCTKLVLQWSNRITLCQCNAEKNENLSLYSNSISNNI